MTTTTDNQRQSPDKNTATKHNTSKQRDYTEQTNTSTRSNAAHRCITIRGGGPASGRRRRTPHVVDLRVADSMIVSGWSAC